MSNTPDDHNAQVPPVPPTGSVPPPNDMDSLPNVTQEEISSSHESSSASSFPPPPPGPNPSFQTPTESGLPSKDERMYAMAMHLSLFAGVIIPYGGFIAPVVLWLIKKDQSPFIDDQGKEVINLMINATIASVICFLLMIILIGFLMMFALAIAVVILVIMGAIKASEGQYYRYPYIFRFIK